MSSRQAEKEKARAERLAREEAEASSQRRKRRMWIFGGAGALAVALVVVAVVISSTGGGGSSVSPQSAKAPIKGASDVNNRFAGIPQNGITIGNPNAPVTLVEFADLKCPVCRDFAASEAFPTLIDKYVKTGKLKMDVRFQTFVGEQFNPGDSLRAARFALAAGEQNKLWQFMDLFYKNQKDEATRFVSDQFLTKLGKSITGLNVAKAMKDRGGSAVNNGLNKAAQEFSNNGFTGTPSFLVGKTGGTLAPLNYSNFDSKTFTDPIDSLLNR